MTAAAGCLAGFWLQGAVHPVRAFTDAGHTADFASPASGNLITGQQQYSGTAAAELVIAAPGR